MPQSSLSWRLPPPVHQSECGPHRPDTWMEGQSSDDVAEIPCGEE
ncbi:hypothetical protein [Lapillicoccus sp.]|nr:hypothetical protein [Lapillicoccus sp.]